MRCVKISDLGQGFPFDGPIEGSALDEGIVQIGSQRARVQRWCRWAPTETGFDSNGSLSKIPTIR